MNRINVKFNMKRKNNDTNKMNNKFNREMKIKWTLWMNKINLKFNGKTEMQINRIADIAQYW